MTSPLDLDAILARADEYAAASRALAGVTDTSPVAQGARVMHAARRDDAAQASADDVPALVAAVREREATIAAQDAALTTLYDEHNRRGAELAEENARLRAHLRAIAEELATLADDDPTPSADTIVERMRAERAQWEVERERITREALADSRDAPDLDATDGAHPAWWRGHDAGCRGMREAWERACTERDAAIGEVGRRGEVISHERTLRATAEMERDALRAILAGQPRAPTEQEIEAHAVDHPQRYAMAQGAWLVLTDELDLVVVHGQAWSSGTYLMDPTFGRRVDGVRHAWPLASDGTPCAGPVVTETEGEGR